LNALSGPQLLKEREFEPIVAGDTPALRVLLVEDSVLLASRLAELICRLPDADLVAVVGAEDEAMLRIADCRPDVLILDLHLRQGSGFGVLRSLSRTSPRPKVIVLTNYGANEYRREAESLGAVAFLDKSRDYGRLPALLLNFAHERAAHITSA
jgi:two-component system OmpR family response regulator